MQKPVRVSQHNSEECQQTNKHFLIQNLLESYSYFFLKCIGRRTDKQINGRRYRLRGDKYRQLILGKGAKAIPIQCQGLERQLGAKEPLLLLQKTGAWFPVPPQGGSQIPLNPAPGAPTPFSALCTHVCIFIHRHINKNKLD